MTRARATLYFVIGGQESERILGQRGKMYSRIRKGHEQYGSPFQSGLDARHKNC